MTQPIESLVRQRERVADVVARRRNLLARIGTEGTQTNPKPLKEDTSDANVTALLKVGRARRVIGQSLKNNERKLEEVDESLRELAPEYLRELAKKQDQLTLMKEFVEEGAFKEVEVDEEAFRRFEVEVISFATLPERAEPLREGIAAWRKQQELAEEQTVKRRRSPAVTASERPTFDDKRFTIPTTQQQLEGVGAALLELLASKKDSGINRVSHSAITEELGISAGTTKKLTKQLNELPGVQIRSVPGPKGGMELEFTPVVQPAPAAAKGKDIDAAIPAAAPAPDSSLRRGSSTPSGKQDVPSPARVTLADIDGGLDSRLSVEFGRIELIATERAIDLGGRLTLTDLRALRVRSDIIILAREAGLIANDRRSTYDVVSAAAILYMQHYSDVLGTVSKGQRAGLIRDLKARASAIYDKRQGIVEK